MLHPLEMCWKCYNYRELGRFIIFTCYYSSAPSGYCCKEAICAHKCKMSMSGDQQKFVACLTLSCPLTRTGFVCCHNKPNAALLSIMSRLTSPWRFCNRQQFTQAGWMAEACLSGRSSTRPLLQGDSAISREFIPDVIIAVKLQPTTNNYHERWQVRCARLPITVLHTLYGFRGGSEGGDTIYKHKDTVAKV